MIVVGSKVEIIHSMAFAGRKGIVTEINPSKNFPLTIKLNESGIEYIFRENEVEEVHED